jgi:cysteine synthase A
MYSILDRVGFTPIVNIGKNSINGNGIFAKAEYMNPGGSIKDRIAVYMIDQAEKRGELKKGMEIVEATSGNTGIAFAMVGLIKGYKVTIIMPENMSEERKKIIKAFNADLILTPEEKNVAGAVEKLNQIRMKRDDVFIPDQFINHDNFWSHYYSTGPEIWDQMEGEIDIFVSGLGSGGTLMGVGKYLKEKKSDIKIIAVEPKNSSALLGHEPGLHKIEGIGDGFVPSILDIGLIDDVLEVSDDDAVNTSKALAAKEGFLVGISSGANVYAAAEIQKRNKKSKRIVTILPDRGERYFSTSLFSEQYKTYDLAV